MYDKHAKNIKTIGHYLTTLNILPATFKRFTRLAANALPSIILKYSNLNESTVFQGALSDMESDAKLTSSVEDLGSELSNPGCSTMNIFKPVQKVEIIRPLSQPIHHEIRYYTRYTYINAFKKK